MFSHKQLKKIYWKSLSRILPSTAFIGFTIGFIHNIHIRKTNTICINRFWGNDRLDNRIIKKNNKSDMILFINLVGYTSMGICVGILYPISFPICMIYTVYHEFLGEGVKKIEEREKYHKR
jgi:hypothetical protein